jgi:hypothetical protein
MKLTFSDKFALETEINGNDITINGKLKRLTKEDEADIKKKFKKELDIIEELGDLSRQSNRLELMLQIKKDDDKLKEDSVKIYDRVIELQKLTSKSNTKEDMAKYRFNKSVESDNLKDLISICEAYGYADVLDAINKDIEQGKQKNTSN